MENSINLIEVNLIISIMMKGDYSFGCKKLTPLQLAQKDFTTKWVITDKGSGKDYAINPESFERAYVAVEAMTNKNIDLVMLAKQKLLNL